MKKWHACLVALMLVFVMYGELIEAEEIRNPMDLSEEIQPLTADKQEQTVNKKRKEKKANSSKKQQLDQIKKQVIYIQKKADDGSGSEDYLSYSNQRAQLISGKILYGRKM